MTMPFEPINEVSRRQAVVDMLSAIPSGEVVPYDALEIALGLDRHAVQSVVNQAKPSLQKIGQKSLVAVRNIGYRVLSPGEHIDLARDHQKKGRRQTRKAKSAVAHTDYAKLSDIERAQYDIALATISALERFERRADLRYASKERVDAFIREQGGHNDRTTSEVSDLKSRLGRLEDLVRQRKISA